MIILSVVIVFVFCTLFLGLVSKGCWHLAGDKSDWTLVDLFMEGLFLLAILWVLCVTFFGCYFATSHIWGML